VTTGCILQDVPKKIRIADKRQCTFKPNNETRSCNHCCSGKAINITYSEYVSIGLVIQHAKHMRRIVLSSLACPVLQYIFPNYLINGAIFLKNVIEREMCVRFFLQLSQRDFSF